VNSIPIEVKGYKAKIIGLRGEKSPLLPKGGVFRVTVRFEEPFPYFFVTVSVNVKPKAYTKSELMKAVAKELEECINEWEEEERQKEEEMRSKEKLERFAEDVWMRIIRE